MGAASNAGYDVGTDSELYRQYRAGAQAKGQRLRTPLRALPR